MVTERTADENIAFEEGEGASGAPLDDQALPAESQDTPSDTDSPQDELSALRTKNAGMERELQRLKSVDGRVRSVEQRDAEIAQSMRMMAARMRLLTGQASDPDSDPDEVKRRSEAIDAEEFSHEVLRRANDLHGSILNMQTELQEEFGIDVLQDQRFTNALSAWEEGVRLNNDLNKLSAGERAFANAYQRVLREQLQLDKKEQARLGVDERRQNGNMRAPRAGGAGGPSSDNDFIIAYSEGTTDDHDRYRKIARARGWMS
tara:strand:+ start:402 stop:1184 length:783 start_codon:yes stop_codon:yes gene_type:complete